MDNSSLPNRRADALAAGNIFYFTGTPCINGHTEPRYTSTHQCLGCHKSIQERLKKETKERQKYRPLSERKKAMAAGEKTYFTGYPCKNGHISDRLTSNGSCSECSRINSVNFYRNPKNKEKIKEYRKSSAEIYRAHSRNRKANRYGNPNNHSPEDISSILSSQGGKCSYCRKTLKKWHVDHIHPLSKGGDNSRSNLQITCQTCNLKKGSLDPLVFAQRIGLLV